MRGGVAAANEGGSREAKSKGTSPVGTLSYPFGGAPFPPVHKCLQSGGKEKAGPSDSASGLSSFWGSA